MRHLKEAHINLSGEKNEDNSSLKLSFSQAYKSIILHTCALNVTFYLPGRFYNIEISRDNIVTSRTHSVHSTTPCSRRTSS